MIQFLKRLFSSKNQESVTKPIPSAPKEQNPEPKEVLDKFGQIPLGHRAETNYEYYLKELENGATHYRVVEDRKKNFMYDCDDMEDSYCYLTIEIYYKDKTACKRYSLMGECTYAICGWHKIPQDLTAEQVNDFIINLSKPRIW